MECISRFISFMIQPSQELPSAPTSGTFLESKLQVKYLPSTELNIPNASFWKVKEKLLSAFNVCVEHKAKGTVRSAVLPSVDCLHLFEIYQTTKNLILTATFPKFHCRKIVVLKVVTVAPKANKICQTNKSLHSVCSVRTIISKIRPSDTLLKL